MEPIDRARVAALSEDPLAAVSKAVPPEADGLTPAAFLGPGRPLAMFNLPLLTLDQAALRHNIETMRAWVAGTGMLLAPHGKTTMAPQLWQQQLDAGAWGITLANAAQLRVGWHFGVSTVMIANPLLDPQALKWVGRQLSTSDFRLVVWADSVAAVQQMDDGLAGTSRSMQVCVELGAPGGRTGARTAQDARAVAKAIAEAANLQLVGVAGYEGALAHDAGAESLGRIDEYLESMRGLHHSLEDHYEIARPIVTAGGSAYFDRVYAMLGTLASVNTDVVLRSGAYVVHDDGFYDGISPLSSQPAGASTESARFRSAMHGWGRVLSRPEPGLVLLDAGKRDLPFDEGLPVAQWLRRGSAPIPLAGSRVTAINDQHLFLQVDPATDINVGEIVQLGLSHPCTAFDKWSVIPLINGSAAEQPQVVDFIRTFF